MFFQSLKPKCSKQPHLERHHFYLSLRPLSPQLLAPSRTRWPLHWIHRSPSLVSSFSFCSSVYLFFFGWTASFFFFAVRQLSLVVWNRGHPSLQSTGFSWQGLFLLQRTGSRGTGFNSCSTGAHSLGLMYPRAWAQKLWHTRLSFSEACEIFPDQNLNPCPLQWQADPYPLRHQGSLALPLLLDANQAYTDVYNFSSLFYYIKK